MRLMRRHEWDHQRWEWRGEDGEEREEGEKREDGEEGEKGRKKKKGRGGGRAMEGLLHVGKIITYYNITYYYSSPDLSRPPRWKYHQAI